ELRQLGVGERAETGAGLLAGRFGRQPPLPGQPAGEVGMGADQRELFLPRRGAHGRAQLDLEVRGVTKRPPGPGTLGDPGRVFEEVAERRDEGGLVEGVDGWDVGGHRLAVGRIFYPPLGRRTSVPSRRTGRGWRGRRVTNVADRRPALPHASSSYAGS